MNLIEIMERFPDQESCIEYLEHVRWQGTPHCTHCGSLSIRRKKEDGEGRVGRWHCKDCSASFKITHGTVFHGTKIPLQKWFLAICLILNAKKGISSYQLQRDLELNQKTAWFILIRIRAEMANKVNSILLHGIIELNFGQFEAIEISPLQGLCCWRHGVSTEISPRWGCRWVHRGLFSCELGVFQKLSEKSQIS